MQKPKILNREAWSDASLAWSEQHLVIAVAETLRQRLKQRPGEFAFAHDMNGGQRSRSTGGVAKAMGMTAGEPDMRFYLPRGGIGFIEYKTDKGKLSPAQKDRHEQLAALGHDVRTVFAGCPEQAINATHDIIDGWVS